MELAGEPREKGKWYPFFPLNTRITFTEFASEAFLVCIITIILSGVCVTNQIGENPNFDEVRERRQPYIGSVNVNQYNIQTV